MPAHRLRILGLVLTLGGVFFLGCEPYMSMTDQVPSQTRRATTLLPEHPTFVGMMDVASTLPQLEKLTGRTLSSRLEKVDNPSLQRFLDATGIDPVTDLEGIYGATVDENAFTAVLFGEMTAQQLDRYLDRAPAEAGRTTTYRGVPLYHLALGERAEGPDTVSVAFVGEGTVAAGRPARLVTDMVDRHLEGDGGLQTNEAYMTLVKRVGRNSSAWLVGRNVVEAALQDSGRISVEASSPNVEGQRMTKAGVEGALSQWADRVLGLSEVSTLDGQTGRRLGRLTRMLREQAVSVRLTDTALDGKAYLTMQDEASASSVVDVAEGAVAILRLSQDQLDKRHRDLLDGVEIRREGSIVHIRFSLEREMLRKKVRDDGRTALIRRSDSSIRLPSSTFRQFQSIKRPLYALRTAP